MKVTYSRRPYDRKKAFERKYGAAGGKKILQLLAKIARRAR